MCSVEEPKIESILTGDNSIQLSVNDEKRKLEDSDKTPILDKHPKLQDDKDNKNEGNSEKVRKKPGRKPATSEPADKRVAQNRAAQRAFRERKENYVKILEGKIEDLEKAQKDATEENKRLQEKLAFFERQAALLKNVDLNIMSSGTTIVSKSIPEVDSKDKASSESKEQEEETTPSTETTSSSNSAVTPPKKNSSPDTNKDASASGETLFETPLVKDIFGTDQFNTLNMGFGTPLIDYSSSVMNFNNFGYNMSTLYNDPLTNLMPSLADNSYLLNSGLDNYKTGFNQPIGAPLNTSFPNYNPLDPTGLNTMNFMNMGMGLNFDPIMLADHTLNYDPLAAGFPDAPAIDPSIIQGQAFLNQQYKEQMSKNEVKEKDDFDLDSLCSLMKDKAKCSEAKKFMNEYCKNQSS